MGTTLFHTLTLLAHQLSLTPCPLSPMVTTQVFMVILMPTVAFTATPDARSVMLKPRPPLRLTPRPRLPLMPGTDTTDVPAIMVDTTAVDMEAMEATMEAMEAMEATAVDMEAMED